MCGLVSAEGLSHCPKGIFTSAAGSVFPLPKGQPTSKTSLQQQDRFSHYREGVQQEHRLQQSVSTSPSTFVLIVLSLLTFLPDDVLQTAEEPIRQILLTAVGPKGNAGEFHTKISSSTFWRTWTSLWKSCRADTKVSTFDIIPNFLGLKNTALDVPFSDLNFNFVVVVVVVVSPLVRLVEL